MRIAVIGSGNTIIVNGRLEKESVFNGFLLIIEEKIDEEKKKNCVFAI
ncbi:MAG: hypothetical protein JSV38_12655 [Desulfobacterales bacterium]|nr:MAG: hypothetical protein JSV38_12655 [Desulfobacterales bacterium]